MRFRILSSSLLLLCLAASQQLHSQQETVSVGPGYADEVYYDMQDGITKRSALGNWDIGFQVVGFASSIITNGGTGTQLYVVPGKGAEDFGSAIDTAGITEGQAWYNSATTWDQGAFNLDADYETGNFGWGQYNMVTHTVTGSTLYVIILQDGTAKQIVIDGLSSGTYSFSYADIDGSNQVNAELKKSDFAGKNFGYYSISEKKTLDIEPQAEEWDLVFGKYIAWVGPNNDLPYVVTGIRSNPEARTAEVESATPDSEPTPDLSNFTTDITTIGHDWKEYTGTWTLRDAAYFVEDLDGNIFRVVFSDFGGSGTGDITFNKQQMNVSSVNSQQSTVARFSIYPNIISTGDPLTILLSLEHTVSAARIVITDAAGRVVLSQEPNLKHGLQQIPLEQSLTAGWYNVTVDVNGARLNRSILVQ